MRKPILALLIAATVTTCVAASPAYADSVVDLAGYEIHEAADGPELLSLATRQPAGRYALPQPKVTDPGMGTGTAPPAPDVDGVTFATWMLERIRRGEWLPVVGGGLMLLSMLLRMTLARAVSWFRTRAGGVVLSLAVAFTSILGLGLAAGAGVSVALFLTALGSAAAASGLWTWLTDVFPGLKAITKGTGSP